jgi:hypothetical protein
MKQNDSNGNGSKRHAPPRSLNGAVKSICDILRRSNCAGALQYVPKRSRSQVLSRSFFPMCSRYTRNKDEANLRLRDKIIRVIPAFVQFRRGKPRFNASLLVSLVVQLFVES